MNQKRKMFIRLSLALGIVMAIATSCTTTNPPVDPPTDPKDTTVVVPPKDTTVVVVPPVVVKTSGTLAVSTVTSTAGGGYAPKHVVAIWVEDNAGKFVKTLLIKAADRIQYLTKWNTSTAGNTVDAITGATVAAFGTQTCTWNGKNVSGAVVSDGTYKVCMELTDKNGTGNYASFSFTKGKTAATLTPAKITSFATNSIKWTPM